MSSNFSPRLEIARKLLNLPQGADVMKHIEAMKPEDRAHLRGLVDWVEEYEKHEKQNVV